MAKLKFAAQDAEDLEVLATHLQDMILRVGDIAYLKSVRRFAAVGTRFCWEHVDVARNRPKTGKSFYRARTGFHFDGVERVQMRGFEQGDEEAFLVVLGLTFEATGDGAGTIAIILGGGADIRLDVECIEASMSDLSAPWPTDQMPRHNDE
jgi:DUF2948 family protein